VQHHSRAQQASSSEQKRISHWADTHRAHIGGVRSGTSGGAHLHWYRPQRVPSDRETMSARTRRQLPEHYHVIRNTSLIGPVFVRCIPVVYAQVPAALHHSLHRYRPRHTPLDEVHRADPTGTHTSTDDTHASSRTSTGAHNSAAHGTEPSLSRCRRAHRAASCIPPNHRTLEHCSVA
jgi:hypothetical protein